LVPNSVIVKEFSWKRGILEGGFLEERHTGEQDSGLAVLSTQFSMRLVRDVLTRLKNNGEGWRQLSGNSDKRLHSFL